MVLIELKSAGIGNCLFQYSAAKALAIKNKTKVKFDITMFSAGQLPFRKISEKEKIKLLLETLEIFNIDIDIASKKEIKSFRSKIDERGLNNRFLSKILLFLSFKKKTYFKEKSCYEVDPKFFRNNKNVFLEGYFINPKYFINSKPRINLTINSKVLSKNISFFNKIISTSSVSIHVRRGDYILKDQTNNKYPIYGVNYYKKAIEILSNELIDTPTFFVFSDDIPWCKENFKWDNFYFACEQNKPYEDFHLMSICKHNIITNSTFSWWAAYLNKNTNKKVIAPKIWHYESDTDDLLLKDWIII